MSPRKAFLLAAFNSTRAKYHLPPVKWGQIPLVTRARLLSLSPTNGSTAFEVGDLVRKTSGDYQLDGEVRAVFTTKRGKVRYVVEHEPGFLHIYSDANLSDR